MLLHPLDAGPRQVITPRTDDAGHDAHVDQVLHPAIGRVEVLGPHARVIRLPRKAGFVAAALVEGRHVGIQPGHDLHDVESLLAPVGGERLKFIRPNDPLAQAHPPGIGQPQKGRAVGMFQMPPVGRDAQRPVAEQRIVAVVGGDFETADGAVQARVGGVGALAAILIPAHLRRSVARLPALAAGPKAGHLGRRAVGRSDYQVELRIIERIGVIFCRGERQLEHPIGRRARRVVGGGCQGRSNRAENECSDRPKQCHPLILNQRFAVALALKVVSKPPRRRGQSPVLLRGLRKRGTVPGGFETGSRLIRLGLAVESPAERRNSCTHYLARWRLARPFCDRKKSRNRIVSERLSTSLQCSQSIHTYSMPT